MLPDLFQVDADGLFPVLAALAFNNGLLLDAHVIVPVVVGHEGDSLAVLNLHLETHLRVAHQVAVLLSVVGH